MANEYLIGVGILFFFFFLFICLGLLCNSGKGGGRDGYQPSPGAVWNNHADAEAHHCLGSWLISLWLLSNSTELLSNVILTFN